MKKLLAWMKIPVLVLTAVVLYAYGLDNLLGYSLPLTQENYGKAMASRHVRKAEIFYNGAITAYNRDNLDEAKRLLVMAYDETVNPDGSVSPLNRQLAADIQFLLGKCLHWLEKDEPAIAAYEQSLRLDADNLVCKYNLEMLKPPSGDGGDDGDEQGDGKGGSGQQKRKGKGGRPKGQRDDGGDQPGGKDGVGGDGDKPGGKDGGDGLQPDPHGKIKPKI